MMAFGRKRAASPAPRPVRRALLLAACALAACLFAGAAFATGSGSSSGFTTEVNDVPATAASQAASSDAGGSSSGMSPTEGGLELSKTATYNQGTGDYTITLEAYATGESTTTVVKDGVDIVLMLDLSDYMYGSTTTTEKKYTYASVESNTKLNQLSLSADYYYYKSGDDYYPVTITTASGGEGKPGHDGPSKGKTYTIVYSDGTENVTIVKSKNGDTQLSRAGDGETSVTLYTRTETTVEVTVPNTEDTSKLNALKAAVNGFIEKVHSEAPASRIAIVTYADEAVVESGLKLAEDEALVTVDAAGAKALKAIVEDLTVSGGASNSHYAAADAVKIFQDVPADSAEYNRQRFALLFSAGVPGTGWDTNSSKTGGKDIAQATMHLSTVLKTAKGSSAVLSTGSNFDGGKFWSESEIAGLLGGTGSGTDWKKGCGAKVYCVGLDIPSSGDPSQVDMTDDSHKPGALANEYFWRISSHRPDGSHITSASDLGTDGESLLEASKKHNAYNALYYFYPDRLTRNQTPGYYMTTTSGNSDDLAKLNDIFKGIASSVVTDVTVSTTLGSTAVVKDVIAPSFTVPANTSDVKIYTANCTGAGLTFENRTTATGVTATIEGDTLNVTGFDFSENWCGSHSGTYSGKKLIIEFNVSPKDGFLGGNNVPTNGDKSGVYVGDNAVAEFDVPTVNVPVADVTIIAADKNVYLTQVPTDDQLKSGVTIKCGNVDITDPSKLEDWQKAYVDISSSFTCSDGFDATAGGTYTVAAAVKPKTEGDSTKPGTVATAKTGTGTKNINVFKPELTYRDSEVWYGDTAPTDYSDNLTDTEWKHGETLSTAVVMIDTAPTLDLTCTPDATKISGGKVDSKDDIPVVVAVKIGTTDVTEHTAFVHAKCDASDSGPENGRFWLHVKTCSLTIKKVAADGTTIGDGEYFVFNVEKDDEAYTQVVVKGTDSVTISGLPVGDYTVSEDSATAWRYRSSFGEGESSATLSEANSSATVTCTNTLDNGNWLNHFARAVNVFGSNSPVIESNIAASGLAG